MVKWHLFSFALCAVLLTGFAHAGVAPEWRYSATIDVKEQGLVRARLPFEVQSQAQPSLADLRVMDPIGQEMSFFVDQPMIEPARQAPLMNLIATMAKKKTILTGEVPPQILSQGVSAIVLESPTDDFLKPVTLEGSNDRSHWTMVAQDHPIFKQPGQYSSTQLELPKLPWRYLRVTLDDESAPPIRVAGISVFAAPKQLPTLQTLTPQLIGTTSDNHHTDIDLLLPADHLTLDSARIDTTEETFRRYATVAAKVFVDSAVRESVIGQGAVYRISLGSKGAEGLSIPIHVQVPGRELVIHIENGDSRPLPIRKITVAAVPAFIVFRAPTSGAYSLWMGNPQAPVKTYDVAALRDDLVRLSNTSATIGSLAPNPAYKAPEPLPDVNNEGTDLDVSAWHFKKPITLNASSDAPSIYRVELDLETLAHNTNPAALRIVRNGMQLPYITDPTGVMRSIGLPLTPMPAAEHQSIWRVSLPDAGTPIRQLQFQIDDPLFQRHVQIFQTVKDDRGDSQRQLLTDATWTRIHNDQSNLFSLLLNAVPQDKELTLQIDNGDNPPLHVSKATAFYQAPRILFKASSRGAPVYLYYGPNDVSAPQYDLNLIAGEILSQAPVEAKLGPEEALKVTPWYQMPIPAGGLRWIFWIVMGLVVVGLVTVIVKLLPEEAR